MNENRQKELLNNTVSTVEEFIVYLNSLIAGAGQKDSVSVSVLTLEMTCSLLNLEKTLMLAFYEWGETNAEVVADLAKRIELLTVGPGSKPVN